MITVSNQLGFAVIVSSHPLSGRPRPVMAHRNRLGGANFCSHGSSRCRVLYGPAARRKMNSELGEREKLQQCIRPLEWSSSCSGPRWVSARIQGSLAERLLRAKTLPNLQVAPGRPFVHLVMSSSRPRREAVECYLVFVSSFVVCRVT
jgi:hypothetical protein